MKSPYDQNYYYDLYVDDDDNDMEPYNEEVSLIRGKSEYTILSLTIPEIPGITKKITHKLQFEASYPDDIKGEVEKELKKCVKASLTDGMQVLALSAVAASTGGPIAMMSAVTGSITPAISKVRESFVDCVEDIAELKTISNQVKFDIVHKTS